MMMCSMILGNQMTSIVYSLSKRVKLIFKFFFHWSFTCFFLLQSTLTKQLLFKGLDEDIS